MGAGFIAVLLVVARRSDDRRSGALQQSKEMNGSEKQRNELKYTDHYLLIHTLFFQVILEMILRGPGWFWGRFGSGLG